MKPVGLKFKNMKKNPFTGRVSGELMIVHKCLGCGAISANRIAGDDNCHEILKLSNKKERETVATTLFGHNYQHLV